MTDATGQLATDEVIRLAIYPGTKGVMKGGTSLQTASRSGLLYCRLADARI